MRFPSSHRMVVCNSFVLAKKAAGAKAVFNARVASYLLGVQLVRKAFPQLAPFDPIRPRHPARDARGSRRRESTRSCWSCPSRSPPTEARRLFSDDPEAWSSLAPHLTGPDAQGEYPVRGVMLYGVGECARAREAVTACGGATWRPSAR